MKIKLVAYELPLFEAFEQYCTGISDLEIIHGSILDVTADAYVSPANSYGFMDGGIDALYCEHFGDEIQSRVREAILYQKHGELLVGDALIVETGHDTPRYLIAAPTMRVPMILGPETISPYLAMRAIILLIRRGAFPASQQISSIVKSVAVPGLGTGIGRIPPEVCAKQVRQAILDHRDTPHSLPRSWSDASANHQLLYSKAIRDLQR